MLDQANIPSSWSFAKLGEVAHYQNGRAFKPTEWNTRGLPIVRIQNLNNPELPFNRSSLNHEERYRIVNGDLLFAWSASLGAFIWNRGEAWLNQHIFRVSPYTGCDKHYLFYALNYLSKEILDRTHGSGMVHITKANFDPIQIPLPPLAEQARIVAKIEELFSSLDKGVESLKTAKEQLKVYRQAVLKWALEGKLTNNTKTDNFTDGWNRLQIKDLCTDIKVGIVVKPSQYYSPDRTGVKVFRSANIREFRIDDSNWVYFTKDGNDANLRTKIYEDDVLIVRSGYPGTSCLTTKEFSGSNAIDIIIARVNPKTMLPQYLCAFNNSPLGHSAFRQKTKGSAQQHLNVGEYEKIEVAFPDIIEQSKILSEIDLRFSICSNIEATIEQGLAQAEALRQSILKKAFEGRLVPQDPKDEPASVLLERIRAERAAEEHKRPARKNAAGSGDSSARQGISRRPGRPRKVEPVSKKPARRGPGRPRKNKES